MFNIHATRGELTRTGSARTATGLTLAAVNVVASLTALEERGALLPAHTIRKLANDVLTMARRGEERFTARIADIILEVVAYQEHDA